MKKIFLLFAAAVTVLSSCVKENGLEPQVNTDGKVTINAVAVDSKTVLDGLNVVWENEDALSVVLAGDVTSVAEFSAESVDGAEAKFVYDGTEALALEDAKSAYAVYPASAVSQEGGVVKISHSLPEVQTGVVESGMNLSSAALSVEQLVAGQATATFNNALALLQVVVPEGVSEVSLHTATGSALVGDMTFNVVDGVLSVASNGTKRTVTLSTGSELAEGTHNLLVYPGYAPTLTLTMTATDDAVYTSEVSAIRFTASESRTINLTQIFKMGTEETMYASPAGGEVVVPVVTAADYTYEVAIEGNPEWLTYALPTKAFHGENIVFTASKNETGAERSANVTISWGENQTRTFTIAQKAIYMDFVNDADGNPIQWEETFGVYGSESDALAGTNAKATYKNVFTIELSDNFNKGTYKIVNAFYENNQLNGRSGETYYADYEGSVLSIYKGDSGYVFDDKVITLTYNENSKEFVSAGPIKFNYTYGNADLRNGGYIGGYKAVVKVEEPAVDVDPALAAFVGTWNETWGYQSWGDPEPQSGTFEVSIVDGKLYFAGMFNRVASDPWSPAGSSNYYGELSSDGKTITLSDAGGAHPCFSPTEYTPVVLNVVDGKLVAESTYDGYVVNYVAVKDADPLQVFVGTWDETWGYQSWGDPEPQSGTFEVSIVDGKLYFAGMFNRVASDPWSPAGSSNYYGELSSDGKTITLSDAGGAHPCFSPTEYTPVVLNVVDGKLVVESTYDGYVVNYVAIKR